MGAERGGSGAPVRSGPGRSIWQVGPRPRLFVRRDGVLTLSAAPLARLTWGPQTSLTALKKRRQDRVHQRGSSLEQSPEAAETSGRGEEGPTDAGDSPGAGPVAQEAGGGRERGRAGEPSATEWLEQRALEVEYSLRKAISCNQDLGGVTRDIADLNAFLHRLDEIAAGVGFSPGEVLQVLLGQLANRTRSFDSMGGVGNVPMHQAKVLDRSVRLAEAEQSLMGHVADGELSELVERVNLLRTLLRVKVEDPNDLTMARSSVYSAFNFFSRLKTYADDKEKTPYEALCEFRL